MAISTSDRVPQGASILGRAAELEQLRSCLRAALSGTGQLVLIGGEAGIGKTTLAATFAAEAQVAGAMVLDCRCYDSSTPTPYSLWTNLLQHDQAAAALQQEASDPPMLLALHETAPIEEIAEFIRHISSGQPVVLLLEDVHWADQPSLELLRQLARRLASLPVLVVCTYRDVDLTPAYPLYRALPQFVREAPCTRVPLRRLSEDDVRVLLRERYRLSATDERRLLAWLDRLAEGSPFFLLELLNALELDGVLFASAAGWELGDLQQVRLPQLVQQVIDGYLSHLSEQTRDLLQLASIIGEDVPLDLWQAVAGAPEDQFVQAVEQCIDARVLVESGSRPVLRFRHALIREALYRRMVLLRRRAWHRRVAEALMSLPSSDVDEIAHHFLQAHDPRAADWLMTSGRRAARAFAFSVSAARLEQAIDILRQEDTRVTDRGWLLCELAEAHRYTAARTAHQALDEADQIAREVGDHALEVVAQACRVRTRFYAGESVLDDLRATAARVESLDDIEMERIRRSTVYYACCRGTRAQTLAHCGAYAEAIALAEDVLQLTTPAPRRELGDAYYALGLSYAATGHPEEARSAFATAREHYRHEGALHLIGATIDWELDLVMQVYAPDDPPARARLLREGAQAWRHSVFVALVDANQYPSIVETMLLDGRWAEARTTALALREVGAQSLGCARILADLDWLQGYPERAWTYIREALPDGPDAQPVRVFFPYVLNLMRIASDLALDARDADSALAWINAYERWCTERGVVAGRSISQRLWSRYYEVLGDTERVRHHAERMLETALEPRQPLGVAFAQRRLAELDLRAGAIDAAEPRIAEAMRIADACNGPFVRAMVLLTRAELESARGHVERAVETLASVRDIATALDATPLLSRATALAERLQQPQAVPLIPGGLSAREMDVLRLVAQGLTDAEVGERLFISPRTVGGHLQSIYNKLGLSSRTAATAFAFEHDLI
jgi:DNA-binding CsgD family transcriptional regulator/RecA/RadA recombinase